MKKKIFLIIPFILIVAVVASLIIPKETLPSKDTRIILEHTYQTYIAPTCFEKSDPTNNIEDSTLQRAEELNYPPHSDCTEEALKAEKDSLLISILKDLDLIEKKWD